MQKKWLSAISIASVVMISSLSGVAVAQQISAEDMQSIRQYCDEMYGFGSFPTEEERKQAVNNCVEEEVNRAKEYGNTDGGSGDMEKPE